MDLMINLVLKIHLTEAGGKTVVIHAIKLVFLFLKVVPTSAVFTVAFDVGITLLKKVFEARQECSRNLIQGTNKAPGLIGKTKFRAI